MMPIKYIRTPSNVYLLRISKNFWPTHCSPSGFFYGLRLASSAPFSDFEDRSNWFYSMSSMGSFSSLFSLSSVLM